LLKIFNKNINFNKKNYIIYLKIKFDFNLEKNKIIQILKELELN